MTGNLPEPRRLFKKLTRENWREYDGTTDYFVRVSPDGHTSKLTGDDWAERILESKLSESVPKDVRYLFEVAQGALCYGIFFYPLYTLGSEQLYRVLEAALRHRCVALCAPKRIKRFEELLSWFDKHWPMGEMRLKQWHAARHLRNRASHAIVQSIYDPTTAVRGIRIAEELINELYDSTL